MPIDKDGLTGSDDASTYAFIQLQKRVNEAVYELSGDFTHDQRDALERAFYIMHAVPVTNAVRIEGATSFVTDEDIAAANAKHKYPIKGSIWKHSNGNLYEVVVVANAENTRERYPATVVYENVCNGKIYARVFSDWHRSMTYRGVRRG